MIKLPRLYAITDLKRAGKASHLAVVKELIKGGASLIQLREKELPARDFFRQACEAIEYAHRRNVKIIINDRVDIALAAGADGVHLGQHDMPVICARKLLGPRKIIGISTHNLRQFSAALRTDADYISIGPIYPTRTKTDPDPPLGPKIVARLARRIDRPLVAIGGITLENAPELVAAGADSVAVISDLLSYGEIASRTRAFLQALESVPARR